MSNGNSNNSTPGSNIVWTSDLIAQTDFMVFRDIVTDQVTNVVAPNGLQVGLFDDNHIANLNVTGDITGSGEIYALDTITAAMGFTGSLQKLVDGTSYLVAGSNVTITSASNGQVTIAANASSTTANDLTAGTGLAFNAGSTFDGSAAKTLSVDINSQTQVTPASGDFVLVHDITDGALKKVTVNDIQAINAIDIAGLSNSLTDSTVHQNDLFAVADVNDSNEVKKITLLDISEYLAAQPNGAIAANTDGRLYISQQALSSMSATIDPAADTLMIDDTSDGTLISKKTSIASIVDVIRGTPANTGLNSSSGVLNVDINGLTTATPAASDQLMIYDADATSLKKISVSSIGGAPTDAEYVVLSSNGTLSNESVLTAGDGLDLSGATFSVDLKSSAGLKIDSTELAIEPSDFAGSGLEDDGSDNLRIATSAAGTGLTGGGGSALSVQYGSTAGTAVQGNTTVTLNAGDGLSGGGSNQPIGSNTTFTLDIQPEDFSGTGLSVSGNDINAYLKGDSNISITTGSESVLGINLNQDISVNKVTAPHITGSLTALTTGAAFIKPGNSSIQVSTGSDGSISISAVSSGGGSVGTITEVTAGTGLTGGGNSGNVSLAINNSVVATLTGSQFSGNVGITGSLETTSHVSGSLIKAPALTGSLTKLENGNDYLNAGPGITLSTGSDGSITINTSTSGGTIGEAEDGTYEDGVFTDFVSTTPTGTAVDRFNELLKLLAPAPAPDLDNIDINTSDGITANLSFGSSNNQFFASPSYASSSVEAGFSSVNVNGSYAAATSGANLRKGIYNGSQAFVGDLNEDVAINQHNSGVTNHVANAFGNANEGTLQLYVNGAIVHSVDLTQHASGVGVPGSGTASQLNSNSSGFINLSQSGSAVQSTNVEFPAFKHRTGQFQVGTADQRNGWNYVRIVHDKGGTSVSTNYAEWINDPNSDALAASGNSLNFVGSGSIHLSGVEYFQSGTVQYKTRVTNAYKYVYDSTAISFPVSDSSASKSGLSFSLANQAKPTIDTGNGENHTKVLHLTASATANADYFLSGTFTAGVSVTHPLKSDLTNAGQSTISPVLMYNLSNSSTDTVETFRRENYRILSASYDTQASVVDSNNVWNSNVYMTASNGGHSNGLQFFDQKLVSPLNTINSGNFSIFANGPDENPNYSGQTGTRTFIRWFKNTTGSTQYDLSLALNGSGTIVKEGNTLNTSTMSVLIKLPGASGWMDASQPFVLDSVGDTAGAHIDNSILNFDDSLNATNYLNFGNVGIQNNNYVVLKIITDESWTGNVSNITVDFGAGTGTLTTVPDLDDIDVDQDGTDANLSFGSSKSISGYTDPTTAAGFTAANLNDLYQTDENSNNLRASVFAGSTTIEGDLNEDVSTPGNDFVNNAFSDANSGSLKLEVNGAVIHTVALTGAPDAVGAGDPGSGSDTEVNGDGSGFISLSKWGPGLFDNGVPRYSEIQRTAKYRIVPASQRNGWNYARVIHTVGGSDRNTNFVEWINDPNANALSSSDGIGVFGDDSFQYMSGVKYFTSPSGSYFTRVSHIYKNVYSDSNSAISFTGLSNVTANKIVQAGPGLSSTKTTSAATDSLQTLNTNANSQDEVLHVTGTINFTQSKSLPGTYTTAYNAAARMVFDHPLKSNLTTATQTATNLLVWTPSDSSNLNTNEYFTGETYRMVSGSYTAQSHASDGSKNWNSQRSLNDQGSYPEHATGLLIYDTYLIPPKDGGASGDFRNHSEGGSIESPVGNVNYSSGVLTNANRDYYRRFQNNTTNDLPAIDITIYGDATLVASSGLANTGALGSNKNIFVDVAIPGKTGFLDLGKPTEGSGNVNTGDGSLSGDIDQTIDSGGATNRCTFNGVTVDGTVSGAEYIIIRVTASKNWTGYLDRIAVSWS